MPRTSVLIDQVPTRATAAAVKNALRGHSSGLLKITLLESPDAQWPRRNEGYALALYESEEVASQAMKQLITVAVPKEKNKATGEEFPAEVKTLRLYPMEHHQARPLESQYTDTIRIEEKDVPKDSLAYTKGLQDVLATVAGLGSVEARILGKRICAPLWCDYSRRDEDCPRGMHCRFIHKAACQTTISRKDTPDAPAVGGYAARKRARDEPEAVASAMPAALTGEVSAAARECRQQHRRDEAAIGLDPAQQALASDVVVAPLAALRCLAEEPEVAVTDAHRALLRDAMEVTRHTVPVELTVAEARTLVEPYSGPATPDGDPCDIAEAYVALIRPEMRSVIVRLAAAIAAVAVKPTASACGASLRSAIENRGDTPEILADAGFLREEADGEAGGCLVRLAAWHGVPYDAPMLTESRRQKLLPSISSRHNGTQLDRDARLQQSMAAACAALRVGGEDELDHALSPAVGLAIDEMAVQSGLPSAAAASATRWFRAAVRALTLLRDSPKVCRAVAREAEMSTPDGKVLLAVVPFVHVSAPASHGSATIVFDEGDDIRCVLQRCDTIAADLSIPGWERFALGPLVHPGRSTAGVAAMEKVASASLASLATALEATMVLKKAVAAEAATRALEDHPDSEGISLVSGLPATGGFALTVLLPRLGGAADRVAVSSALAAAADEDTAAGLENRGTTSIEAVLPSSPAHPVFVSCTPLGAAKLSTLFPEQSIGIKPRWRMRQPVETQNLAPHFLAMVPH